MECSPHVCFLKNKTYIYKETSNENSIPFSHHSTKPETVPHYVEIEFKLKGTKEWNRHTERIPGKMLIQYSTCQRFKCYCKLEITTTAIYTWLSRLFVFSCECAAVRRACGAYLYAYLRSLSNSIRLRVFVERPHEVQ
ncbi:hypothetical protein QTP88_008855 [Uroleucon formosanum]